jgi:hypothetical protein
MANTIIALKQSGATGNTPIPTNLETGELALNYADGILYFRTSSNTLGSIRTTQPGGLSGEVQFNDAGSFGGDSGFTYDKTTNILSVDNAKIDGINVAPTLQSAFNTANGAESIATAAFSFANSVNVFTQSAYNQANTAGTLAQNAYDTANTALSQVGAAFNQSNNAIILAQFAADTANNAASIGDVLAIAIALG